MTTTLLISFKNLSLCFLLPISLLVSAAAWVVLALEVTLDCGVEMMVDGVSGMETSLSGVEVMEASRVSSPVS